MEQEPLEKKLKNFLDQEGRLTAFPAKRRMKTLALAYLAEKFEAGRRYSEKEVNELLEQWHVFRDPATLRRELYNSRLLEREANGAAYWPAEDLAQKIQESLETL